MTAVMYRRAPASYPWQSTMTKEKLLNPTHPERICWGCDRYCPAHDLVCGNGTIRTPHPRELFGDDWQEWAIEARRDDQAHDTAAGAAARVSG